MQRGLQLSSVVRLGFKHHVELPFIDGCAIVDFQDGAWYDIPASDEYLVKVDAAEGAKYKNVNSAQVIPEKQG